MTDAEKAALQQTVKEAVNEACDEKLEETVKAHLPLALGEVLGPEIHRAISVRTRRWRLLVMVGYLLMFGGLFYVVKDNRDRATSGRSVVCQILVGGDASLYAYEREGTLTRRQLRRGLKQSAEYRRLLGPAPGCHPTLTPEPKRLPSVAPRP